MATIESRGNLQYRAKIRKKGYAPQSRTFDTKTAAKAWARTVEAEMDRGVFVSLVEAERTTLGEALDRYEREITPAKKGWKQEKYRIRIWRRDPLAMRPLASIRSTDLASWRDNQLAQGFAASTQRLKSLVPPWPLASIRSTDLASWRDNQLAQGFAASTQRLKSLVPPRGVQYRRQGMGHGRATKPHSRDPKAVAAAWPRSAPPTRRRKAPTGGMRIVPISVALANRPHSHRNGYAPWRNHEPTVVGHKFFGERGSANQHKKRYTSRRSSFLEGCRDVDLSASLPRWSRFPPCHRNGERFVP